MLTTNMFISGCLGFILDNTIPGTLEERGVTAWRALSVDDGTENNDKSCYDIPFITDYIKKYRWSRCIPCFPTFQQPIMDLSGQSEPGV